jgi:DNA-binding CsgD family transcriptional regulator
MPTVGDTLNAPLAAMSGLRARVAMLDTSGVVSWTNPSWSRHRQRQGSDSVDAVALGVNYVAVCRRSTHPAAVAIAEGVRVVLDRVGGFFELETGLAGPPARRTQITATPAPGGAVLMQVDVYSGSVLHESMRPSEPLEPTAMVELTPRERQVLLFMSQGLGNQAIATEIGVMYSTVRAHVRSIMEKLDARSRLEAVVRAVELGIVHLPGTRVSNEASTERGAR